MADIFNRPNWEDASDYSKSPSQPNDRDFNIIIEDLDELDYNRSPLPPTNDDLIQICDELDELDYNKSPLPPSDKDLKKIYADMDELEYNTSPLPPSNEDLKIILSDMRRMSFKQPIYNKSADTYAPNDYRSIEAQYNGEYSCSGKTTLADALVILSTTEKTPFTDGKSDYTVSPIAPSRNDLRAICKELDTVKRYSNIMPCEGRFIDSPRTDSPNAMHRSIPSSTTLEIPGNLHNLLDMRSKTNTYTNQTHPLSPRASICSGTEPDGTVSIHLLTLAKELYSPLTPSGEQSLHGNTHRTAEPVATCSPPVVRRARRRSVTNQNIIPSSNKTTNDNNQATKQCKSFICHSETIENKENSPSLNISPVKLMVTRSQSRERAQSRDSVIKDAFSMTMDLYEDALTPTKAAALANSALLAGNDKNEKTPRRKIVKSKLYLSAQQSRSNSSGRLQSTCNEFIEQETHASGKIVRSISVCRQRPRETAMFSSARVTPQLQQNSVSTIDSTSRSISPVQQTNFRAREHHRSNSTGRNGQHKPLTTEERQLKRIEEAKQLEKGRIAKNRMLYEKIKEMHSMTGSQLATTISTANRFATENNYLKSTTNTVTTKKAPTVSQPFQLRTELRSAQSDIKGKPLQFSNNGSGVNEDVLRRQKSHAKVGSAAL